MTATTVRPIQTHYAGHHFRSRLEARWAVFFDHMGIAWEYEPQGYQVGVHAPLRPYLPDFRLHGWLWVEVKGSDEAVDWPLLCGAVDGFGSHLPLDPEIAEQVGVCGGGQSPGSMLVVLGNIPPVDLAGRWEHVFLRNRKAVEVGVRSWYPGMGKFFFEMGGIEPVAYHDATCGACEGPSGGGRWPSVHGRAGNPGFTRASVRDAYAAARQARFEHGQSGGAR